MDLKLLIVDDERQIRLGLQRTIDWAQIGVTKVYAASNAQEGISMFYRYRPQIVLMDILMPGIDGLETCARIKREDKATRVFVITGHLTTDYVRRALSLGVEEYFVKPVKIDEFVQRIGAAATELMEQGFRDTLRADGEAERNKNTLVRLLRSGAAPTRMQMDMLGLDKPGTKKRMLIADIRADYETALQIRASVNWHLEKLRIHRVSALLPEEGGYTLVALAEYAGDMPYPELLRGLYEIINNHADETAGVNITIGAERAAWSIASMYAELVEAAKNAFFFGTNSLIEAEKLCQETRELKIPSLDALRGIAAAQRSGEMGDKVDELFGESWRCGVAAIPEIRAVAAELLMTILNQGDAAFRAEMYKRYARRFFSGELRSLREYLDTIFDAFSEIRRLSDDMPQAVKKISRYIEENYRHDITVTELSECVGLSRNYVSYLYKKACGKSIIQSLNEVRIAQAKKLMSTESTSLYDISKVIGYNNYPYFTRIFRQIVGMTPSAYRIGALDESRKND